MSDVGADSFVHHLWQNIVDPGILVPWRILSWQMDLVQVYRGIKGIVIFDKFIYIEIILLFTPKEYLHIRND